MYLLDANIFITAKNAHYGFDIVPGFWSWLEKGHAARILCSVEAVWHEIDAGQDELRTWAYSRRSLFLPWDRNVATSMTRIASWAQSGNFTQSAVSTFLNNADSEIVAHAHAHSHVVVTHERSEPTAKRRILIPDACNAMGVRYTDPYSMLRKEKAKFTLG